MNSARPDRSTLSRWRARLTGAMLLVAASLCSCAPPAAPAAGAAGELRIVSLSPAMSRTLLDMGLADSIVGCTPYCTMLDDSVPKVGDLLNLDRELLVRLHPTHLFIQPTARGVDDELLTLARRRDWRVYHQHLNTVQDVRTLIAAIPAALHDDGAPREMMEHRAATLKDRLDDALGHAEPPPPGSQPRRLLLVDQVDPVLVFGAETYLDDLIRHLGWTNAARAGGWAQLALEDVVRLNPDAVIVVEGTQTATSAAQRSAEVIRELPINAARGGRVAVLAHPDALMPSTGLIEVLPELRKLLAAFEDRP